MVRKAKSGMVGFGTTQGRYCRDCRRELDCGREPEVYLVDDGLWKRAGLHPHDGLCLHHLSLRIGRPLRFADFVHMSAPPPATQYEGVLAEDVLVLFQDWTDARTA